VQRRPSPAICTEAERLDEIILKSTSGCPCLCVSVCVCVVSAYCTPNLLHAEDVLEVFVVGALDDLADARLRPAGELVDGLARESTSVPSRQGIAITNQR
jgi:hypothetical protein